MPTARRTWGAWYGSNGGSPCTARACVRAVAAQDPDGNHRWAQRHGQWPLRCLTEYLRSVRGSWIFSGGYFRLYRLAAMRMRKGLILRKPAASLWSGAPLSSSKVAMVGTNRESVFESRPTTITLPLYSLTRTQPFTLCWVWSISVCNALRSGDHQ